MRGADLSTMDRYPNLSTPPDEYEVPERCRECGTELKIEKFTDVLGRIQEEAVCPGCGSTETTL